MSYYTMDSILAKEKVVSRIDYLKNNCYPWNNETIINKRMKEGYTTGIFRKKKVAISRDEAIVWLMNNSKYLKVDDSNFVYWIEFYKNDESIKKAEKFLAFVESAIINGVDHINISLEDSVFVS